MKILGKYILLRPIAKPKEKVHESGLILSNAESMDDLYDKDYRVGMGTIEGYGPDANVGVDLEVGQTIYFKPHAHIEIKRDEFDDALWAVTGEQVIAIV